MNRSWASLGLVFALFSPTMAATPVVALLDPGKSDRVPLLEAKLVGKGGITLVERAVIETVLKEQQLQAAFGAKGVGDRIRLGRVLKADVLVMIRPLPDAKALTVVVSETAGGLRLLVRALPLTEDPAADADALHAMLTEALKKFGQDIEVVVAVPPFVSQDLTPEFGYLKGAFAKLAEEAAISRPGVVAVELAEAEALGKELQLAAPDSRIRRTAPLYLMGEYRTDGRNDERRIRLTLRCERVGKPVGAEIERTMPPRDAAAVIHDWARTASDSAMGTVPAENDVRQEARRLASRARDFQVLGEWAEAVALGEASLLLDPGEQEVRLEIMRNIVQLIDQVLPSGRLTIDPYREAVRLHRRGLEHLEALMISGYEPPRPPKGKSASIFLRGFGSRIDRGVISTTPEEIKQEKARLDQDILAVYIRVLPYVVKRNFSTEMERYFQFVALRLPGKQRYDLLRQYIDSFLKLPGGYRFVERQLSMIWYVKPWDHEGLIEYRKFLDELDARGDPKLTDAISTARKRIPEPQPGPPGVIHNPDFDKYLAAEAEKRRLDPEYGFPPRIMSAETHQKVVGSLIFKPVRLEMMPKGTRLPGRFEGLVGAGPGTDLIWDAASLYLVTKEGFVTEVYKASDSYGKYTDVVYDGRFVWAAFWPKKALCSLIIVDPTTAKIWTLTDAEGLPQTPGNQSNLSVLGLRLAVLGPGRVLVGGCLGRAWLADVRFDAATAAKTVKVIHEAREVPNDKDENQWKRTACAFFPGMMCPLVSEPRPDGSRDLRILVPRECPINYGGRNRFVEQHPLIVDPDRGTVTVMEQALPDPWYPVHVIGKSERYAFFAMMNSGAREPPHTIRVSRVDYPGVLHDIGQTPPHESAPALFHDGKNLHFLSAKAMQFQPTAPNWEGWVWYTGDADGKNLTRAADKLPPVRSIAWSSIHGLVVLVDVPFCTIVCSVKLPAVKSSEPFPP